MLDLKYIVENRDRVIERLTVRNFKELHLVDELIELEEKRRKLKTESETTQAGINAASSEISQLITRKENSEPKKKEVAVWKASLQPLSAELADTEARK